MSPKILSKSNKTAKMIVAGINSNFVTYITYLVVKETFSLEYKWLNSSTI